METGGEVTSEQRRRSSPTKTRGRGSAAAVAAVSSSKMSDLHRSQSHEPRHTPPLFLIPSATVRETAADSTTTGRPARSPASRLSDPGKAPPTKQMNADDEEKDDDADRRSTLSAGRDTVVQLNYGGTPEVVVDGGKSISGSSGVDGDDPAGGKTSPVDMATSGGHGGDGDGDCCRSPLDVLAGCQAAWLGGIELAQNVVHGVLTTHGRLIKRVLLAVVLLGFAAYLVVAIWKSGLCTLAVIVLTILAVFIQSVRLLKRFCGQRIDTYIIAPVRQVRHSKPCLYLKWSVYLSILVSLIVFIVLDVWIDTKRLTSLAGLILLLLLGFLTSNNPSKV